MTNYFTRAKIASLSLRETSLLRFIFDPSQLILNIFALGALTYLILVKVVFADARPWFNGAGNVASLLYDLSLGYLAAWLFFFLSSWRPAYSLRLRAAPFLVNQVFDAYALSTQMVGMLVGSAHQNHLPPYDDAKLAEATKALRLNDPSTLTTLGPGGLVTGSHPSVLQALWKYVRDIDQALAPVIELSAVYDLTFLSRVADFRRSHFVRLVEGLAMLQIDTPLEFTDWAGETIGPYLAEAQHLWDDIARRHPSVVEATLPNVDLRLREWED